MPDNLNDIGKKLEELKKQMQELQGKNPDDPVIKEQHREIKRQTESLQEQLKAIEANTEAEKKKKKLLQDQSNELLKQNEYLAAALTLNKHIANNFQQHGKDLVSYLGNMGQWFQRGQEIATEYYKISRNMGLSRQMTQALASDMKGAVGEVMRMGGSLEDIGSIYKSYSEQSGRVAQLRKEEIIALEGIAKGTEIYAGDIAQMAEQMGNVGVNAETAADYINKVFVDSQKMGLNSRKVIGVLQSNMRQMSNYSFANGVKGMTEMAKQAVSMRMEVSDLLGMAENLYNPEQAIESAAELQLMGGEIAKAFGDPFETMYLARNKPEELAKRVQDMTTNMLQFNEQTGEFELPPEARQQLNFASEKLGLSKDNMIEMARQSGKLREIKMNLSGNAFEEETLQGLAGLAKFRGGKWVVDHKGAEIELSDTSQIQDAIGNGLLEAPMEEKDALNSIAKNTMNLDETMDAINKSIEYQAAGDTGIYEVSMDKFLRKGITKFEDEALTTYKLTMDTIGGDITSILENSFGTGPDNVITKSIDVTLGNFNSALMAEIQKSGGAINTEQAFLNASQVALYGKIKKADDIYAGGEGNVLTTSKGSYKLNQNDSGVFDSKGNVVAGTDLFGDINLNNTPTAGGGTTNNNLNVSGTIDVRGPQGTIAQFSPDEIKKLVMKIMAGDDASGGKSSNMSAMYQNT